MGGCRGGRIELEGVWESHWAGVAHACTKANVVKVMALRWIVVYIVCVQNPVKTLSKPDMKKIKLHKILPLKLPSVGVHATSTQLNTHHGLVYKQPVLPISASFYGRCIS